MVHCLLLVNGSDYDVTNLMNEESLYYYERAIRHPLAKQSPRRPSGNASILLYPNLEDPCNRRLMSDVEPLEWKNVRLVKASRSDSEGWQQKQREQFTMTSLPQRSQTAPLSTSCQDLPSFQPQQTVDSYYSNITSRRSLPPVVQRNPSPRCHRHSTTSASRDFESSNGGLRPRVNYKSIYARSRNLSSDSNASSLTEPPTILEDSMTDGTMSSHARWEEDPVSPITLEIAPNVRVEVRPSQETHKALQTGDFLVVTCFACTTTMVCVNDAAYVLCPDCQVVSPLHFGVLSNNTNHHHATKKEDPHGVGTGLKRDLLNEWVGSV